MSRVGLPYATDSHSERNNQRGGGRKRVLLLNSLQSSFLSFLPSFPLVLHDYPLKGSESWFVGLLKINFYPFKRYRFLSQTVAVKKIGQHKHAAATPTSLENVNSVRLSLLFLLVQLVQCRRTFQKLNW